MKRLILSLLALIVTSTAYAQSAKSNFEEQNKAYEENRAELRKKLDQLKELELEDKILNATVLGDNGKDDLKMDANKVEWTNYVKDRSYFENKRLDMPEHRVTVYVKKGYTYITDTKIPCEITVEKITFSTPEPFFRLELTRGRCLNPGTEFHIYQTNVSSKALKYQVNQSNPDDVKKFIEAHPLKHRLDKRGSILLEN